MFGEIFGFIRDFIEFLWPFRLVHEWERAGYYVCGRWWREMGPGLKMIVPWFCHVETVTIAPKPISTGRKDITLADGRTLSFDATATARVSDVQLALNAIDDFHHSATVLLAAVVAEKLAEVDVDRLKPERRGRLIAALEKAVHDEAATYGIEIGEIRFTSFVTNVKMLRLLIDQEPLVSF
jgi:regulator of protease activity HflC (stomatin/prohibitin superfamily)